MEPEPGSGPLGADLEFDAVTVPLDRITTSSTAAPAPSVVTTVASSPGGSPVTTIAPAGGQLDRLAVAAEVSDAGYRRELFVHWIDVDGDGCDTRCEVLEDERLSDGGWFSVYDEVPVAAAGDLDIDHLVALGEAWRSGADQWDSIRRREFANDLARGEALIAVTASSNRSKSDKDPSEWRPPSVAYWCRYARDWVSVKLAWGLAADPPEVEALRTMLATC